MNRAIDDDSNGNHDNNVNADKRARVFSPTEFWFELSRVPRDDNVDSAVFSRSDCTSPSSQWNSVMVIDNCDPSTLAVVPKPGTILKGIHDAIFDCFKTMTI